jgi:hypothetical protein
MKLGVVPNGVTFTPNFYKRLSAGESFEDLGGYVTRLLHHEDGGSLNFRNISILPQHFPESQPGRPRLGSSCWHLSPLVGIKITYKESRLISVSRETAVFMFNFGSALWKERPQIVQLFTPHQVETLAYLATYGHHS